MNFLQPSDCTCVVCSVLTLCDPMDCSPPGTSVHEIFQARILEQVAISYFRGIFLPQLPNLCLLHLLHWQAGSLLLSHLETLLLSPCCAVLSHSIMSDSLRPLGLQPARLLCSWGFSSNSPRITEVGCRALLQGSSGPRD